MGLFSGEIEAFPSNQSILISLAADDSDTSYEVEMDRSEELLSSFLRKTKAMSSPSVSIDNYSQTARDFLHRNVGSVYIDQGKINSVIDVLHQVAPDKEKMPSNAVNMKVSETVTLTKEILLNDHIIEKGKKITFYHRGHFNE